MNDEPFESARQWANHDPNAATSTRLLASLEAAEKGDKAALAEVAAAMSGPLELGTAGLRGEISLGKSHMDFAVVIHVTAGLAAYLKTQMDRAPRVIVGYDARYDSVDFARATTRVPSVAGCHTLTLPVENPTPLTSFTVRALDTDAGITVTAFHDPTKGNGYKVYLGGTAVSDAGQGAQIVPPHDVRVTEAIATCPPTSGVSQDTLNIKDVDPRGDRAAAATALAHDSAEEKAVLKITLTTIRDVGGALMERVLTKTGFTWTDLVAQQTKPSPDFPATSSPSPEEPDALDLAMEEAQRSALDLIITIDPDANRCVLAIPDPNAEEGQHQLSDDKIGSLLGEYIAQGAPADSVFASSIVSSRLLEHIVSEHGLGYQHALTGLKWVARTPGIRFGCGGAIGFCPDPDQARDKDGISISVIALSLFAGLKAKGSSGQKELDRMTRAYGYYLAMPLIFRVGNLGLITEGVDRLRSSPPKELAGSPVTEVTDLSKGWDGLPGTDTVAVLTETNDRVITRPSGTEPKLKCYLEVILPVEDGARVPWKVVCECLTLIRAKFAKAISI